MPVADTTLALQVTADGYVQDTVSLVFDTDRTANTDGQQTAKTGSVLTAYKITTLLTDGNVDIISQSPTLKTGDAQGTTCVAYSGAYYCPVPLANTTLAIQTTLDGYVEDTASLAFDTDRTANTDGQETAKTGSVLTAYKITAIPSDGAVALIDTGETVKAGNAQGTTCVLNASEWYCPVPVADTTLGIQVTKDGYVADATSLVFSTDRSANSDGQQTVTTGAVLTAYKITTIPTDSNLDVINTGEAVNSGNTQSTACVSNAGVWYCPVPVADTTLGIQVVLDGYVADGTSYAFTTDRAANTDGQQTATTGAIKSAYKITAIREQDSAIMTAAGGTTVNVGAPATACVEYPADAGVYYCAVPKASDGLSANDIVVARAGYADAYATSIDRVADTDAQRTYNTTSLFRLKVTTYDEVAALLSGVTVTYNTQAPDITNASGYFFAQNGPGDLSAYLDGYVKVDTTLDTALANLNTSNTGQSVVVLSGTTPCTAATVPGTTTCDGLKLNVTVVISKTDTSAVQGLGITDFDFRTAGNVGVPIIKVVENPVGTYKLAVPTTAVTLALQNIDSLPLATAPDGVIDFEDSDTLPCALSNPATSVANCGPVTLYTRTNSVEITSDNVINADTDEVITIVPKDQDGAQVTAIQAAPVSFVVPITVQITGGSVYSSGAAPASTKYIKASTCANNGTLTYGSGVTSIVCNLDATHVSPTVTISETIVGDGTDITATGFRVSGADVPADISTTLDVQPGALTGYVVVLPGESVLTGATKTKSGTPSTQYAATAFAFDAYAVDAFNNLRTGDVDTLTVTEDDTACPGATGCAIPADFALVGGTANVAGMQLITVGSRTIGVQNVGTPAMIGTSTAFTLSPSALDHFTVTTSAQTVTVGTPITVTVTAKDSAGNTITSYVNAAQVDITSNLSGSATQITWSGAVTDNGTDAYIPASGFSGGVAIMTLTNTKSELSARSIIATLSTDATKSGTTDAGNQVVWNPATAVSLGVTGFTDPVVAGVDGTATVTAYDTYGNIDVNYAGTVHATSTDAQAVLPADYTFIAGVANDAGTKGLTVNLRTVSGGDKTITFTDTVTSSITGNQSGITVTPAGADSLAVTGLPDPFTYGGAQDATLTAYDEFGNVATDFAGAVTMSSSDTNAVFGAVSAFTSGVATCSVTLMTMGDQDVTASSAGVTSTPQTAITVEPGPTSQIVIIGPIADATAGVANSITIQAQDSLDQLATSDSSSYIQVGVSGSALIGTTATTGTIIGGGGSNTATIRVANGVAVFSVTDNKAESVTVTLSNASFNSAYTVNDTMTVNPAALAKLEIVLPGETGAVAGSSSTTKTGTATAQTAGVAFDITAVNALDEFNNLITTGDGSAHRITITTDDTVCSGTTPPAECVTPAQFALVGGTKATVNIALVQAGTKTITATDDDSTSDPKLSITATVTINSNPSNTNLDVAAAAPVADTTTDAGYTSYSNAAGSWVLKYPTTSETLVTNMAKADGVTPVQVRTRIFDSWGNPVAGKTVYMVVTSEPTGAARMANATIGGTSSVLTDSTGLAEFPITSDTAGDLLLSARIDASDAGTFVGVESFRVTFRDPDTTAPEITVTNDNAAGVALADGDIFELGQPIVINFSVYDNPATTSLINASSLQLLVNGTAVGGSPCTYNATAMTGTCTWNTSALTAGSYNVGLRISDNDGNIVTSTFRLVLKSGLAFEEVHCMPNPFRNPGTNTTAFTFQSTKAGVVTIELYSSTGQLVWTTSRAATSGYNAISWSGRNLDNNVVAAGIYFYRIMGAFGTQTVESKGKLAVIK